MIRDKCLAGGPTGDAIGVAEPKASAPGPGPPASTAFSFRQGSIGPQLDAQDLRRRPEVKPPVGLAGPQLDAQDLRRRPEVKPPVGLVAIPDPRGMKDAALVGALLHRSEEHTSEL